MNERLKFEMTEEQRKRMEQIMEDAGISRPKRSFQQRLRWKVYRAAAKSI